MKKLWQFSVGLAILVFSLIVSFGQVKKPSNLKSLVNQYAENTIRALNKKAAKENGFKYKVIGKNTFNADVNGDGEFDAVVEMFFCEINNCHPTTKSSELVIFLNNKGSFRFAASKGFSLFGKINSIEDKIIYVDVYDLDEDDPQCCPNLKSSEEYFLKGSKLIKIPHHIE
jgi:hypothetical protein